MNWLKIIVLFLIFSSSLTASLASYYFVRSQDLEKEVDYLRSNAANSSKDVTVIVVANFYNGTVLAKVVNFELGNKYSAFNATQRAFNGAIDYKYYSEYKDFIISRFFDVSNDQSHFWSLYINNIPSSSGAFQTILSANDVVEWRYQGF